MLCISRCGAARDGRGYCRMLYDCLPHCGAAREDVRLVRPRKTVIIRLKRKRFVLYSNSYFGVLNNYDIRAYLRLIDM